MRRKGTPIGQYGSDLDFGVPSKEYIKWVLERLYKENILIIIKKCKFYIKKTDFVRFIIKLK